MFPYIMYVPQIVFPLVAQNPSGNASSYTVPISLSNIFNRMAKKNGRKHKLLKINKRSARPFSALRHLSNPGYTTELTIFLPDIRGTSTCSFTPVYSGIFDRLSVLWKGQCNFTLLLLHIHRGQLFFLCSFTGCNSSGL